MQQAATGMRAPVLVIWTLVLSALTVIFGAAPLRVLRRTMGSGFLWFIGAAIASIAAALGWNALAMVIAAQVLLIGSYAEFEEREFTLKESASFAVFLTTLFICSALYVWAAVIGKGWHAQVLGTVDALLTQLKTFKVEALDKVSAQDIVAQLPSAALIFIILSLGLALIFESKVSQWVGVQTPTKEKLSDFSAPDMTVWFFIFSLLGAFGQTGVRILELVSINILNVCVVVYFFQGLAVLGKYFEAFRITPFWRFLWVLILVIQLPILMSLLGLVDFWADFRRAFVKRAADLKKRRIQD